MPKRSGKLIPTKKNVFNKKTGTTSEITYYIDPDKNKTENKPLKSEDPIQTKNTKGQKEGNTITPKEEHPLSNIKDFEDFGKNGVDPVVARQFFCNL